MTCSEILNELKKLSPEKEVKVNSIDMEGNDNYYSPDLDRNNKIYWNGETYWFWIMNPEYANSTVDYIFEQNEQKVTVQEFAAWLKKQGRLDLTFCANGFPVRSVDEDINGTVCLVADA